MSVALLIQAVQSNDLNQVKQAVEIIRSNTKDRFSFTQALNQGLPENGITVMHVACKMFALANDKQAQEDIIAFLIEQGAHPYSQAYIGSSKRQEDSITPMQCCERGQLPKALHDYLKVRQPSSIQHSRDSIPYSWAVAGINMDDFTQINQVLEREKVYAERRAAKSKRMHREVA